MHTHNSALAYAKLSSELYINSDDRVANHAPLHFDISTFGYFSAPLACATTIIIPDAFTKLPASLAALIAKEKITIWYSVPLAIIQLYLSETLKDHDYSNLRWVLFGGENFTMKYLKLIMGIWKGSTFSNVYGPAEVNQCTYFNFNDQTVLKNYIPIGEIWNETMHKIIDENDKEVNDGEIGELLIHSTTMMQGYWKNPVLTNKSFYVENIDPNRTRSFYRTGDLVRLNSNNQLVFLGRNDRQVKLRGYRIELDEIEVILSQHPRIGEARVCVIENSSQEKLLVAAVVPVKNVAIDIADIQLHCKSHLPSYAVPNRIELLKLLPRTSSGKIDLNAIKDKIIALEV
jgi:acyl-coenzyme A synthetase/AMP-(fatty) acid ligase